MPPTTRKAPAKKAAAKKTPAARKRGPVGPPKAPAAEVAPEVPEKGPAPVSEENNTPEGDDKPKRGRKPNVVGQASARFQKARANLARWEKRAAKVQSVNDGLAAAREEFEAAQAAYREAFEASLNNPPAPVEDDEDGGDE